MMFRRIRVVEEAKKIERGLLDNEDLNDAFKSINEEIGRPTTEISTSDDLDTWLDKLCSYMDKHSFMETFDDPKHATNCYGFMFTVYAKQIYAFTIDDLKETVENAINDMLTNAYNEYRKNSSWDVMIKFNNFCFTDTSEEDWYVYVCKKYVIETEVNLDDLVSILLENVIDGKSEKLDKVLGQFYFINYPKLTCSEFEKMMYDDLWSEIRSNPITFTFDNDICKAIAMVGSKYSYEEMEERAKSLKEASKKAKLLSNGQYSKVPVNKVIEAIDDVVRIESHIDEDDNSKLKALFNLGVYIENCIWSDKRFECTVEEFGLIAMLNIAMLISVIASESVRQIAVDEAVGILYKYTSIFPNAIAREREIRDALHWRLIDYTLNLPKSKLASKEKRLQYIRKLYCELKSSN